MTDYDAIYPDRAAVAGTATIDALLEGTLGNLTVDSSNDELEGVLRDLGRQCEVVDGLQRAMVRERAIRYLREDLKITSAARMIDAVLPNGANALNSETLAQGRAVQLTDPEPWPEPVAGPKLLDCLVRTFASGAPPDSMNRASCSGSTRTDLPIRTCGNRLSRTSPYTLWVERSSRSTFRGHRLADIRVWVERADGEFIPTRKGISLGVDLLPELADAVRALRDAVEDAA